MSPPQPEPITAEYVRHLLGGTTAGPWVVIGMSKDQTGTMHVRPDDVSRSQNDIDALRERTLNQMLVQRCRDIAAWGLEQYNLVNRQNDPVLSIERMVTVVTRYGNFRHLAEPRTPWDQDRRHYTLCSGVSAWTLSDWSHNTHPLMDVGRMRELPECQTCITVFELRVKTS